MRRKIVILWLSILLPSALYSQTIAFKASEGVGAAFDAMLLQGHVDPVLIEIRTIWNAEPGTTHLDSARSDEWNGKALYWCYKFYVGGSDSTFRMCIQQNDAGFNVVHKFAFENPDTIVPLGSTWIDSDRYAEILYNAQEFPPIYPEAVIQLSVFPVWRPSHSPVDKLAWSSSSPDQWTMVDAITGEVILKTIAGITTYDKLEGEAIKFWPNPSINIVTCQINMSKSDNVFYQIRNYSGELMQSGNAAVNNSAIEIKLDILTSGLYALEVFDNDQIHRGIFLLQR